MNNYAFAILFDGHSLYLIIQEEFEPQNLLFHIILCAYSIELLP